jgi:hypothetical protein
MLTADMALVGFVYKAMKVNKGEAKQRPVAAMAYRHSVVIIQI